MSKIDILKSLFDEKIIAVINVFLENPHKQFSLTQVSALSRINIATTLRIVDKLIKQDIVEIVTIGKSKFYRLKRNEKTMALNKFLKSEDEPLLEFIEKVKSHPRIKKIILESKTAHGAKILLVGNFLPIEKINSFIEEIKNRYNFTIQFVELTEKQFNDMERLRLYDLNKKVIWKREEEKKY